VAAVAVAVAAAAVAAAALGYLVKAARQPAAVEARLV
jgi:hypothetical protein